MVAAKPETDATAAPPDVWPKEVRESQSGTTFEYQVEARYASYEPIAVGDQVFDTRWQAVKTVQSLFGVPGHPYPKGHGAHGMLTHAQAQALRWWFIAQLDVACQTGSLCFETRIVTYEIKYSWSARATAADDVVHGGFGGRPWRGDVSGKTA